MTRTTTPTQPRPPEFELRLQVPGPLAILKLRSALKTLGRRYGMKCVSITEVPGDPGGERRTKETR